MNSRLRSLIDQFSSRKIDAYLVTQDANITYLTRFAASESWLLVFPKKAYFITDFRYVLEARKGLNGVQVERYSKSFGEKVFELCRKNRARLVGLDSRHISLAQFESLQAECPKGVRLAGVNGLVEHLRERKDPDEIALIRRALKLNLQAYEFIRPSVRPGVSERELLSKLENFAKRHKAGFSFPPIIASGPNSCYPHARVTDRKMKNHEPVLIDMGMDINGYKSDLTRMFFLGKIPALIRDVRDHVAEAQRRAISLIRPGIAAQEVDQAARNYLKQQGLAKYFGHSLGHGVGLEIHEGPRLSPTSPAVLQPGMVVTVEPAVYIPGRFGIRLEDMALVTDKGCEVLSRPVAGDRALGTNA